MGMEVSMLNVLIGLLGATLYSTGVILQKKGAGWSALKNKGDKKRYYLQLSIWSAGILMSYVLSGLPTGYASRFLLPQVISALSGWGVVTMVIMSHFILKEKLYISDIVFSALIVAAIIVFSLNAENTVDIKINTGALMYLASAPFLILLFLFLRIRNLKWRAVLLSMFSGAMAGFSLVLMNILVKENGFSIIRLISSRYIYFYLITSLIAAISLQFSYKYGDIILIAPLQTSLTIIYPIICTYFILHTGVSAVQAIAVILIVASCRGILKKR
jgi:drug/metabolite transporter (DMT)-like permease